MAISFRQLRYFVVLSEQLHFGRAAEKLNISQPPLSVSLKQLEKNLGFPLVARTSKVVQLTPAGVVFAEHAKRILNQMESAEVIAAQTAEGFAGQLNIAFVSAMLHRRFPRALKAFAERYPEIELVLWEMNTSVQIDAVLAEEIDLGFIHSVQVPPMIKQHVIETERLMCCVPRDHRLAGRGRINLRDLAGERIITFSREHAAGFFDSISASLDDVGLAPSTNFHIQHWPTIVALVGNGLGVSLVPKSLRSLGNENVHYIEVNEPDAELEVALIHKAGDLPTAASLFFQLYQNDVW